MSEQLERLQSLYRVDSGTWRFILLPVISMIALYVSLWLIVGRRSRRANRACVIAAVVAPSVVGVFRMFPSGSADSASWLLAVAALGVIGVFGYLLLREWDGLVQEKRVEAERASPEQLKSDSRKAALIVLIPTCLVVVGTLYWVSR